MNAGSSTGNRYHRLTIGVHWLTLMLLVAVYALIELREIYPKGSDPRETMKLWHNMLGLTVFGLVFARLVLRRMFRTPPITPEPSRWQGMLAAAMHVALYVFLVVMPLLGWLVLSAKGKPIPYFGLHLPARCTITTWRTTIPCCGCSRGETVRAAMPTGFRGKLRSEERDASTLPPVCTAGSAAPRPGRSRRSARSAAAARGPADLDQGVQRVGDGEDSEELAAVFIDDHAANLAVGHRVGHFI